jgi:hypothetical protein
MCMSNKMREKKNFERERERDGENRYDRRDEFHRYSVSFFFQCRFKTRIR